MHAPPDAYAVKASDMPQVAEFFQGGSFVAMGHDGAVRRRRIVSRRKLTGT
jgi:hypothetical protein